MAVIWQTPGHETNVHGFPRLSLDVQIIVSVFLFLGIVYLYLIIVTFSRYDSIDKKWSERLGQMRHSAIANAQYDYSYPTWAGYAPATAAGAAIPSDSNPELRLSTTHLPPPNHSRQAGMNSIPNPSHSRQSSTAQTTTNPARTRSHRRRSSQDLSPLPYPQTYGPAVSPRPLPPDHQYSPDATPFIPSRLSPLTSPGPSAPGQVYNGSGLTYLLPSPYRATPSPPSPAAYYRSQVPSKPQPPPLFPIAEGEGQEPSASADAHQPSPMVTRQRSSTHQLPVTASYTPEQDQPDRSFSGDSQHQQQQSGSSEHSHYSTNEGQVSDLPNSSPTAFPPDHIEALVPVDTTADDVEKQLDIPHPGPSLGSGPGSPSQSSTLRPGTPQLFSPPPSYLIPNSITGQSWWRNPSPNRITRDWDPVVRDGDKEEETEGETKREREREMERGRGRERDALDPSEYPGPGPYTFSPPEVMTRSVSLPAVPVSAQPSSSSNQPMGSTSTSSPDPAPAPGLNSSRSPSRGDADRDQDVPGINITGFSGTRQEEDADSQDGVSPLELYAINPISRETSTPVSAHTARVQFDTESEEQEH
ncbi:hypothetical protein AX15_000535 [Amanita polypyramis BW_CC]|nr:hypothetical protein AX15_000535 [Amanita polypyramis BW_CC]